MSIEYEDDDRTLRIDGRAVKLTDREGAALRYLLDRAGQVVVRRDLERDVWGYAPTVRSEAVPVMMRKLRRKLEGRLETIRGRGWRLPADEAVPSKRLVRGGLPALVDRFVGRRHELARILGAWEEGARSITLLGTGGVGKTRLAVEHATHHAGLPVVFCDLTTATTSREAASLLAAVLGATLPGEPVASMGAVLGSREPCLYVLDNLEQWGDAGATLANWIAEASHGRFLVTTRERLGIRAETVVPVPPLDATEAEELFRVRVAQVAPTLELEEGEGIGPLVALLDGLPLAIELAAARTSLLTPAQLLPRLTDRFRLLVDPRGTKQTLEGCVAWSWGLLEPSERSVLAQLSVFAGAFSVEDAEAVLEIESAWTVDVLQSLVDRSLVRRAENGRFVLLVTLREFAARELERAGATFDSRLRHVRWFARFGTPEAMVRFLSTGTLATVAPLELVRAELASACRDLGTLPPTLAARMARSAWMLFRHTGPFSTPLACLEEAMALDLPDPDALFTGIAVFEARRMVGVRGDPDVLGARLSDLARSVADPDGTALMYDQWGRSLARLRRHDDAHRCLAYALALHQQAENPGGKGAVMVQLAHVERARGALGEARALVQSAISLLEAAGNRRALSDAWLLAGTLTLEDPEAEHRPEMLWKALEIARSERLVERELFTLISLARQSVTPEEESTSTLRRAARELVQLGSLDAACKAYSYLGVVKIGQGALAEGREELERAVHYGRLQREVGLAMALCNLAFFHLEYAELEASRRYATEAVELARTLRIDEWVYARSTLALACTGLGDLDAARQALPTPEVIERLHPPEQRTVPWVAWVGLLLAEGNAEEADEVARHLRSSKRPIAVLARGRAAHAVGDHERAATLMRGLDSGGPFLRGTRSAARAFTEVGSPGSPAD